MAAVSRPSRTGTSCQELHRGIEGLGRGNTTAETTVLYSLLLWVTKPGGAALTWSLVWNKQAACLGTWRCPSPDQIQEAEPLLELDSSCSAATEHHGMCPSRGALWPAQRRCRAAVCEGSGAALAPSAASVLSPALCGVAADP